MARENYKEIRHKTLLKVNLLNPNNFVPLLWRGFKNNGMILGAAETIVGSRLVFSTGIVTCLVCIASFGDGTRPLHQSVANNWLMLSIMVETMYWFSISSCIWPFDFLLPWYCPHLPTPVITDRRQNLFSWMKSQSVGKIWHTVNQRTTNFFSVNFIFSKSIGFGFYDMNNSADWLECYLPQSECSWTSMCDHLL